MIGATCPCGRIHPTWAVAAVGRFNVDGRPGFVAADRPSPPVRATREEAMRDVCPEWTTT